MNDYLLSLPFQYVILYLEEIFKSRILSIKNQFEKELILVE